MERYNEYILRKSNNNLVEKKEIKLVWKVQAVANIAMFIML